MRAVHDAPPLDLAGMDLNLVVALDALLAERHVTRAAARLRITQSAASHALARLRDLLGDPLLVRGARGSMVATPLAERLAPQLHRVLGELTTVLRGEAFDPATARRVFHLGTTDYVELVMLPKLVERVRRLAPGVELWIHSFANSGESELANGALDCVIGPWLPGARPAGMYERFLFDEGFTCILRAKHPLAGVRMTLARYCALSHLMVAPRGTPGSLVDEALAAVGKTRHVAVAVPHFLVVPYIIASCDLVATLASRIAALFEEPLGLVTLPPPVEIPRFRMTLTWHERNHHDAAHRWLREQFFAVAAEL